MPDAEHKVLTERLDSIEADLAVIHVKLDELLTDSRQARPLLDKYLKMTGKPWLAVKGPRHAK